MPKRSPHQATLTTVEFEQIVGAHPRLGTGVINAARAVLVEGQNLTAAAAAQGFTKQRLAKALANLREPAALPAGWVRRCVALPVADMEVVEFAERQARAKLRGGEPFAATAPNATRTRKK